VIVFPNLFEQVGAKLVQDAVIKVSGKISARDRDGNIGTEAKMIADEVQIVTDQELNSYESIGRKMDKPKPKSGAVKATRVSSNPKAKPLQSGPVMSAVSVMPDLVINIKTYYIQVKDPGNHEALVAIKQICGRYPGICDVILVIGPDKKSAIKMPFKVEPSDALVGELIKLLDEDSVVIK